MIYLLDANVLITAHNTYYPIDGVPEFWAWLVHQGTAGVVKMPQENFEEVRDGSQDEEDMLCNWVKSEDFQSHLLLIPILLLASWRKVTRQILTTKRLHTLAAIPS